MLKKRLDTKENRDYWKHLEECAAYVKAHHLCFSNYCLLTGKPHCSNRNTKDRKIGREMRELKKRARA